MINIGKPYIEKIDNKTKMCAEIKEGEISRILYYEVESKWAEYLSPERTDCFVIDLLYYAMLNGQDIFYEGEMSERLSYQLSEYWIPVITREIPKYKKITINGKTSSKKLENYGAVATGVSGGVDSFFSIFRHLQVEQDYRLTHLTYLNLGGVGFKGIRESSDNRVYKLKNLALKLKLPIVLVDTNEADWYKGIKHVETHPLRTLSSVLALQKLFRVYYFSTTFLAHNFCFSDGDAAFYDLFSIPLLSTENIQFYSHSPSVTRLDKLRVLSDFELSYNNLYVCFRGVDNCGLCEKCKRTMLELYSIGKLDRYATSFNLERFEAKRKIFILEALVKKKDKKWYEEICKELSKQNKIKSIWKIESFFLRLTPPKFRNKFFDYFERR